jgi:threonine/homoserine/homoserine lactone efflux protein
MTFLPAPHVLAAFTLAAFLLALTPGPDMMLFLGETLRRGRAHGLMALFGAATGLVMHTMLAAFGLSALLAASATAFTALKVAGVVYLLWLALQAVRHGSTLLLKAEAGEQRSLWRTYLIGLGINLLNPKIVMFFLTFLPQFVSVSDLHAPGQLTFLGLYFIAIGMPTNAVLILTAERFTAAIRRAPRVMRALDWLFAGLMGAFAARLIFARGN